MVNGHDLQEPCGRTADDAQATSCRTVDFEWVDEKFENSSVSVTGSFCGWGEPTVMRRDSRVPEKFVASIQVPKGRCEFKFIVDGRWCCSNGYNTCKSGVDDNNILNV